MFNLTRCPRLRTLLLAGCAVTTPTLAHADGSVGCPGRIYAATTMTWDATMTTDRTDPCFIIVGNNTLRMDGRQIRCVHGTDPGRTTCAPAVAVEPAPGYRPDSTEATLIGGGGIIWGDTARFEAALKNVSTVRGVEIRNANTAILTEVGIYPWLSYRGTTYAQNVILGCRTGLDVTLDQNSDDITGNFVDCDGGAGSAALRVRVYNYATPLVTRNFLRGAKIGLAGTVGTFSAANCSAHRVLCNIFDSSIADPFVCGGRFNTPSGNICIDPDDNVCRLPPAPFDPCY